MLAWGVGGFASRLLEERDVARAHIAVPYVLSEWETRGVRYWRSAFLSPFVGAIVPLVGCVVLGWTPGLVLLALTVDVAMLWVCDAAKTLLAGSRMDEERAHLDDAGDVLAVIRALERPRLPAHRDLLAPTPRRKLYVSGMPSDLHNPSDARVLIGVVLFCLVLFGIGIVVIFPHVVPWLLAGAALRVGVSVWRTLRARRETGPRPELLPEAGIPTFALALALYPSFLFLASFNVSTGAIGNQGLALILLGSHLSVAGIVATLALHRIHRATAQLRAFAARDLEQLKQRVRQING